MSVFGLRVKNSTISENPRTGLRTSSGRRNICPAAPKQNGERDLDHGRGERGIRKKVRVNYKGLFGSGHRAEKKNEVKISEARDME